MVKSKLKKQSIGLILVVASILILLSILIILNNYFKLPILESEVSQEAVFRIFGMTIGFAIIGCNTLLKMKTIRVDKRAKTIIIKNHLRSHERVYNFTDLDGIFESSYGGNFNSRSLFLIKNEKKIEKISSLHIENYDEIYAEIARIKKVEFNYYSIPERILDTIRLK